MRVPRPSSLPACRSPAQPVVDLMAVTESELAKHLGVKDLEGITLVQLYEALSFVSQPGSKS